MAEAKWIKQQTDWMEFFKKKNVQNILNNIEFKVSMRRWNSLKKCTFAMRKSRKTLNEQQQKR